MGEDLQGWALMHWIMGRPNPMTLVALTEEQQSSIACAWWPDGRRYVVIGPSRAPLQGPPIVTLPLDVAQDLSSAQEDGASQDNLLRAASLRQQVRNLAALVVLLGGQCPNSDIGVMVVRQANAIGDDLEPDDAAKVREATAALREIASYIDVDALADEEAWEAALADAISAIRRVGGQVVW